MIVTVDNKNTLISRKVSLVSVSLVGVQVDDHSLFNLMPCFDIIYCDCNVWIYTKTSSRLLVSVVVTA